MVKKLEQTQKNYNFITTYSKNQRLFKRATMRWSDAGESIVDIVKEEFDLDIPVDSDDEDILVKYLFSEKNSNRLNKIINHLLGLGDKDITDCIWRYFPLNVESYHFEGLLKDMAEKELKSSRNFSRTAEISTTRQKASPSQRAS